MANTIRLRRGSGAPSAGSFAEGEPGWDSTNGRLYVKNAAGAMVDTGTPADGAVTTAKVANDAVTYAKIQNVSDTDKLLGRSTAGAGDIEEITCTAAGRALLDDVDAAAQRTTLGLGTLATQSGTFSGTSSGTNTGDQTITLTGDVTGSGTGSFAATIASGAVTSAKIADGTIVDGDISASAAIADTKLATISTDGKVSNSATTATSANTASAIVARDASGNFTAGTITAALTGNASTATTLQTARTINGTSFNGSANITVTANTTNSLTFNNGGAGGASGSTFNGGSALTVSYNSVGAPSTTGTNASGTWGISISGNSATTSGCTFSNDAADKDNITTRTDSGFWQTSTGTTAEGWPTSSNGWHHLISSTHSNDANYYAMQIAARFDTQDWYFRNTNGSGTTGWSTMLHSGNFNTYAPTKTGGGASGTNWGISITGNAATANAPSGSTFFTQAAPSNGESQVGLQTSGQNVVYMYNSSTAWGMYSPSGGSAFQYLRSNGVFTFFGNCTGSANYANSAGTLSNPARVEDVSFACGTGSAPGSFGSGGSGTRIYGGGVDIAASNQNPLNVNRTTADGTLIGFRQDGAPEGSISVAGATISYNPFLGSHWGRLENNDKPEILVGTIMETIDKLIPWLVAVFYVDEEKKVMAYNGSGQVGDEVEVEYKGSTYSATVMNENNKKYDFEKHVCVKVNDMPQSRSVYGVFLAWDDDIGFAQGEEMTDTWNDMYVASVGNFVVRMAEGQTPQIGDLVVSDGNGCGVVQDDDIIRSKTVGKITTTIPQVVYDDGSFLLTCTLCCG